MMKTMRWSTIRRGLGWLALAGAVFASGAGKPLLGQDVEATREACRCVDRDGNEIEDCTCLRSIRPGRMLAGLMSFGESRARIGITVDPSQGAAVDARGARVTAVLDDGPADEAGLREGDIITRIDGHSLFEPLDEDTEEGFELDESIPVQRLLAIARALDPGDEVEIEFLRDGESHTTEVEAEELGAWSQWGFVSPNWNADAFAERMQALTERFRHLDRDSLLFGLEGDTLHILGPEMDALRWRFEAREGPGDITILRERGEGPRMLLERRGGPGNAFTFGFGSDWALMECPGSGREGDEVVFSFGSNCIGGLELLELKPGLADYFGAEAGVLVTDVHEESATGLQAGDVILRIGDRSATPPHRARRILASYGEEEEVTFHILRRGREMTVTGHLGR